MCAFEKKTRTSQSVVAKTEVAICVQCLFVQYCLYIPTEASLFHYVILSQHNAWLSALHCISNMPHQSVLCVVMRRPIFWVKVSCLLWVSPLVRRSVGCLFIGRYSSDISLFSTFSLRKWCHMSMCFIQSWNLGLCASMMEDWLSMWMVVGSAESCSRSLSNRLSHTA